MKTIAKILACYFLVGSIFPQTDFSQISKFLNLYEHFNQHKAQKEANGETFSMMDFLTLHYTKNTPHKHSGDNNHQQLPLHHFGHSADFVAQSIPSISTPDLGIGPLLLIPINQLDSAEFTRGVFQPPISA